MRYDDILQSVGQIGPYQVRAFLILCIPLVIVALVVMSSVFTLTEPDYRCAVPWLDNDTYDIQSPYQEKQVDASIPDGNQCQVYALRNFSDQKFGNETPETRDCDKWVYDESQFSSSIITEFDLVCDKTYFRATSNTAMFAGSFVGCFLFGIFADTLGRRVALQLSLALCCVTSLLLSFMPDIISVIVVRCVQGMSFQMFAIAISTAMELVGPDWRTAMGMGAEFAWFFGEVLVLPLAYISRDWRIMYIAAGVASFVALVLTSFTPESPRWLLDKGKLEKATQVIEKIAASNKKSLPAGAIAKDTADEGPQVKVWAMFGHRTLVIRTLIIFFNWFTVNFVYYGLSLNLDNLPGNIYVNYLIGCLVEGAAYVITFILLDRLGRKRLHTAAMLSGGVACILVIVPVIFLSSDNSWVVTALAMLGKMASSCCYATLYIMTVEIFPTVVRNSGLALCSIFENTSAMTSPYIADLGKLVGGNLSQALPMLVFGSCALVAAALSTQLPETLGRALPETVLDAINFDKVDTQKKNKKGEGDNMDLSRRS